MFEQTIISLFLVSFIGLSILFTKKSNSIPEHHKVNDKVPIIQSRKPYILISLILFYPIYFSLHDLFKIKIEQIGLGIFSLGIVVGIIFLVSTIIKYKNIDKLGYADNNDYKYDLISIICVEVLFMMYLLS